VHAQRFFFLFFPEVDISGASFIGNFLGNIQDFGQAGINLVQTFLIKICGSLCSIPVFLRLQVIHK